MSRKLKLALVLVLVMVVYRMMARDSAVEVEYEE